MRWMFFSVIAAAVLLGAAYLLIGYVLNAPRVRWGMVVIAGSILLVGGVVVSAQFIAVWRRD